MTTISKDLEEKIKTAHNVEEAAALLRPSGVDATLAAKIWNELSAHRDDKQLSLNELEAISGGANRDWVKDGCAATVEPGSHCGSNDWCWKWDVTYDHNPTSVVCPMCGSYLYVEWTNFATNPNDDVTHYRCKNCGYGKTV